MVKIKFCGMTNRDDCLAAADLGVDFLGFVFFRKSPRCVTPEKVKEITELLNGCVRTVGVFIEEGEQEIRQMLDFCHLDFAQVYHPVNVRNRISAYRVRDRAPDTAGKDLILFDSYTDGFGGSATSFDLGLLAGHSSLNRAFIAGGISEENVSRALALKPFGVDLVSSIEKRKGKKDVTKMRAFVKKVRSFL